MNFQKTISNQVQCFGVGLHTGKEVSMRLLPAEQDTGIRFKRTDITDKNNIVKANYKNVCDTFLGTTIKNEKGVS